MVSSNKVWQYRGNIAVLHKHYTFPCFSQLAIKHTISHSYASEISYLIEYHNQCHG